MNFRVEYFNKETKQLNVMFLDADDSNTLKTLWNQKHSAKGRLLSVCDTQAYKRMLEKYGDIMRPLK